ncbi:MAG TPA: choice-of-anchor tandem repeat GloVer-containing protein [Candidatus Binataceae bacterium]|nr:choice-of-anchor tandem repeat GloVer-containing protein [Candidatus Binataceae bacterium]
MIVTMIVTRTAAMIVTIAAVASLTLGAAGCGSDSSPLPRPTVAVTSTPAVSLTMAGPSPSPTPPGSADSINVLYSFDGTHGADPKGSLVLGEVGGTPTLFGRTAFGGPGWDASDPAGAPGGGVIFSLPASGGALSGEFDFPGGADGYQPHHDAMVLLGSTLWGAALYSGTIGENGSGNGAVYSIDSVSLASTYAVAHAFGGAPDDGANSHSSFGVGSDGVTLYGTTAAGAAGSGTIYCYNTANDPTSPCYDSVSHVPYLVLFAFENGTGKPSGCSNCTGSTPHGRPVVVNIGTGGTPIDVLLGMTRQGGYTSGGNSKGNGTIYAYTPSANAYTVLHLFKGSTTDGAFTDHGNLILGAFVPASGSAPAQVTVYGMTTNGGTHGSGSSSPPGAGVIFAATVALPTPAAVPTITAYTIVHNFGGSSVKNLVTQSHLPDGYNPFGSLVMDDGYLYGMTRNGGAKGGGVIFRMNPEISCANSTKSHCYGLLASFDSPKKGDKDDTGSQPIDNLTPSADGSILYGMTQTGGANDHHNHQTAIGFGTVFSIFAAP